MWMTSLWKLMQKHLRVGLTWRRQPGSLLTFWTLLFRSGPLSLREILREVLREILREVLREVLRYVPRKTLLRR
jgi:hypothetical protein